MISNIDALSSLLFLYYYALGFQRHYEDDIFFLNWEKNNKPSFKSSPKYPLSYSQIPVVFSESVSFSVCCVITVLCVNVFIFISRCSKLWILCMKSTWCDKENNQHLIKELPLSRSFFWSRNRDHNNQMHTSVNFPILCNRAAARQLHDSFGHFFFVCGFVEHVILSHSSGWSRWADESVVHLLRPGERERESLSKCLHSGEF